MGIISLEKSNHLYWLGRYSERAFTTIRTFMDAYDTMLDQDPNAYKHICEKLHIPDVYAARKFLSLTTFLTKLILTPSTAIYPVPATTPALCAI